MTDSTAPACPFSWCDDHHDSAGDWRRSPQGDPARDHSINGGTVDVRDGDDAVNVFAESTEVRTVNGPDYAPLKIMLEARTGLLEPAEARQIAALLNLLADRVDAARGCQPGVDARMEIAR